MEHFTKNEEISAKKVSISKQKVGTVPIRITKATARNIRAIVNKLNKKLIGRKVLVEDVLSKALSLLTDEHLDEVKKSTYSSEDHLNLKHQEYCELNGHISKEKFLELLLQVDLPTLGSVSRTDTT